MVEDYPQYVTSKKVKSRKNRWPQVIIYYKARWERETRTNTWKGSWWDHPGCLRQSPVWRKSGQVDQSCNYFRTRRIFLLEREAGRPCALHSQPASDQRSLPLPPWTPSSDETPLLAQHPPKISSSVDRHLYMFPTHDSIHLADKVTTNLISSARDRTVCESVICLTLLHPPAPLLSTWFRWGAWRRGGGGQVRRLVVPGRRCLFAPRLPFCLTRYLQLQK